MKRSGANAIEWRRLFMCICMNMRIGRIGCGWVLAATNKRKHVYKCFRFDRVHWYCVSAIDMTSWLSKIFDTIWKLLFFMWIQKMHHPCHRLLISYLEQNDNVADDTPQNSFDLGSAERIAADSFWLNGSNILDSIGFDFDVNPPKLSRRWVEDSTGTDWSEFLNHLLELRVQSRNNCQNYKKKYVQTKPDRSST